MTFGRPPLIHNEYIQLDPPMDIELDLIPNTDGEWPVVEKIGESSPCGLFIVSM
jgi:hypothetical protein